MTWFLSGVFDRLILFIFLFVVTAVSIFSPRMAVKILDDFSED